MSDENKNSKALSDEEVEQASGGAFFKPCPRGQFEAGFSHNSQNGDCDGCDYFSAHFRSCDFFGIQLGKRI